jgi:hypothetical protein
MHISTSTFFISPVGIDFLLLIDSTPAVNNVALCAFHCAVSILPITFTSPWYSILYTSPRLSSVLFTTSLQCLMTMNLLWIYNFKVLFYLEMLHQCCNYSYPLFITVSINLNLPLGTILLAAWAGISIPSPVLSVDCLPPISIMAHPSINCT